MRAGCVLLLALLLPGQAAAKVAGCGENSTVNDYSSALVRPSSDFLAALQRGVAADDREAVAGMAHYPLRVNGVKGLKFIATRAQFLTHYPAILTANVKAAIAAQRAECLFANFQGVMIADGEVWLDPEPRDMKIITFNVR